MTSPRGNARFPSVPPSFTRRCRRAFGVLVYVWLVWHVVPEAQAWQLYKNGPNTALQHAVDRTYRDFTYFVSDSYFDFGDDTLKPITPVHVAIVKMAFARLRDASPIALSLTFGGTYASWGRSEPVADETFDHKIYVDFTGTYFSGVDLMLQPISLALPRRRANSQTAIGGTIHLNSNVVAFHHPAANSFVDIAREFLHILGIDHSSAPSSVMNRREYRRATLAADDRYALSVLFDEAPGEVENIIEVWVRRLDRIGVQSCSG